MKNLLNDIYFLKTNHPCSQFDFVSAWNQKQKSWKWVQEYSRFGLGKNPKEKSVKRKAESLMDSGWKKARQMVRREIMHLVIMINFHAPHPWLWSCCEVWTKKQQNRLKEKFKELTHFCPSHPPLPRIRKMGINGQEMNEKNPPSVLKRIKFVHAIKISKIEIWLKMKQDREKRLFGVFGPETFGTKHLF